MWLLAVSRSVLSWFLNIIALLTYRPTRQHVALGLPTSSPDIYPTSGMDSCSSVTVSGSLITMLIMARTMRFWVWLAS